MEKTVKTAKKLNASVNFKQFYTVTTVLIITAITALLVILALGWKINQLNNSVASMVAIHNSDYEAMQQLKQENTALKTSPITDFSQMAFSEKGEKTAVIYGNLATVTMWENEKGFLDLVVKPVEKVDLETEWDLSAEKSYDGAYLTGYSWDYLTASGLPRKASEK